MNDLKSKNPDTCEGISIKFVLNGHTVEVENVDPNTLLINYLHANDIGLIGTKLVCGEAGCGACTVMQTKWDIVQQRLIDQPINSCIHPLVACDGMMITTTEGLGNTKTALNPVQFKLAANNGSQCGFCSAGFVMNMQSMLQAKGDALTEKEIESALDGHICRCTGYRPILEGFKQFASDYNPPLNAPEIYVDPEYLPKQGEFEQVSPPLSFLSYMKEPRDISGGDISKEYFRPSNMDQLHDTLRLFVEYSIGMQFMAGNSSIGIYKTRSLYCEASNRYPNVIDLTRVPELTHNLTPTSTASDDLVVGASISLADLSDQLQRRIDDGPEDATRGFRNLLRHIGWVANHQVRQVASLAGNLSMAINSGFLSDMIVVLEAMGAKVAVDDWSLGNGPQTLEPLQLPVDAINGKPSLYTSVTMPATDAKQYIVSHKVRSRPDNSHAIVNNALWVCIQDGHIMDARLVYNGLNCLGADKSVGGNPFFQAVHATMTEDFLRGKPWNQVTLTSALDVLEQEVDLFALPEIHGEVPEIDHTPWSYRKSLAQSLFYKCFLEISQQSGFADIGDTQLSGATGFERGVSSGRQRYYEYPEELPLSAPLVKMSAFEQTCGDAEYVQTLPLPPKTLDAAYVYSTVARGTFGYTICGKKVSEKSALVAHLQETFGSAFAGLVDYENIPQKEANWAGAGGDEPLFVPSQTQELPASVIAKAEQNPSLFHPHEIMSVGAPICLILSKSKIDAQRIADHVRQSNLLQTSLEPILTMKEAVENKNVYTNNPPTNQTMTHINTIVRPGSDLDWLAAPETKLDGKYETISGTHKTGAQNHFYLETISSLAVPGENGAMTLHASTQNLADNQYGAANALGVSANKINVVLTRLGGGFGGKQVRTSFYSSASAVAAVAVDAPVRLILDRNTNQIMSGNRHPFEADYNVAFDKTGKIHGMKVDFRSNGGNSYDMSFSVMDFVQMLAENVYDIKTWQTTGDCFQTNRISSTAFRGFGIIQCMNIIEGIISHVAHASGQSVERVRTINLYTDGKDVGPPYEITKQSLVVFEQCGLYSETQIGLLSKLLGERFNSENTFRTALDETGAALSDAQKLFAIDYATQAHGFTPYMQPLSKFSLDNTYQAMLREPEYDQRVAAVAAFNKTNRWKKRGIFAMPLKYGNAFTGPRGSLNQGGAYVLAYSADGTVLVRHGGVEMGQGLQTQMAQIAAHTLGISMSKIQMGSTTTEVVGDAAPTAASTGSDLNGSAVELACRQLRDRLEAFCATLEQYSFRDIQKNTTPAEQDYKAMVETVVLNWRNRWADVWDMVVALAYDNRLNLAVSARYSLPDYSAVDNAHPYGSPFLYHLYSAAISEVEIDVLTGEWNFIRADIRGDIGKSLNPLLDIGQMEGAFIQGLGYLTTEEMLWQTADQAQIKGVPAGAITTYGTWAYKPPTIHSIPEDFRVGIANQDYARSKGMTDIGAQNPDSGVKSSKGASEFALVLANSAFFAIRNAIQAARADAGDHSWVNIDAPATTARIQQACRVSSDTFSLDNT